MDFCILPLYCRLDLGLIGTTFMFQIAVYISVIREVLRPGTLWFIRDPNDPNFNPMKEILKRPFLIQLRKLFVGILLYSVMILLIVGGSVGFVWTIDKAGISGIPKIWPLRWEFQ